MKVGDYVLFTEEQRRLLDLPQYGILVDINEYDEYHVTPFGYDYNYIFKYDELVPARKKQDRRRKPIPLWYRMAKRGE